jgi:hypothetical protein
LTDYAKWELRAGRRLDAIRHLLEALARAPLARWKLTLAMLYDALQWK